MLSTERLGPNTSSKELHMTGPVMPHDVWYNDNTWQLCIQCTFTVGFTNRDKMAMMDAMRVVIIIWEGIMTQDDWITSHNFLQFSPIFLGQDSRFCPGMNKIRIFFAFLSLSERGTMTCSTVSMWLGTQKERKNALYILKDSGLEILMAILWSF